MEIEKYVDKMQDIAYEINFQCKEVRFHIAINNNGIDLKPADILKLVLMIVYIIHLILAFCQVSKIVVNFYLPGAQFRLSRTPYRLN